MATRKKAAVLTPVPAQNDLHFAIITSRYHDDITRPMHDAAKATLEEHKALVIHELWVPGAWELPFAAQVLANYEEFDAIIALGCVIRGETTHHEHIGREASAGLMRVSLACEIPIGFGLLTTDTLAQAQERAGGSHGNKGIDAALSALEMARLERKDGFDDLEDFPDLTQLLLPPQQRRSSRDTIPP